MAWVVVLVGLAPPAGAQTTDSTLAIARTVLARLSDTGAARAAGYEPLVLGPVADLGPFQGQHWINYRLLMEPQIDLDAPAFLMFVPRNGTWVPVGVAYGFNARRSVPMPSGLAGYDVEWHEHQMCLGVPGEGPVLADGLDDCRRRGGTATGRRTSMVHVWTTPTPDGLYAHDNPALPLQVVGLRGTFERTWDVEARRFALALGETYGARLPQAVRLQLAAGDRETRRRFRESRAAILDLIPALRSAESRGDRAAYAGLRMRVLRHYADLLDAYRAMAPTPELLEEFNRQLATATRAATHRH